MCEDCLAPHPSTWGAQRWALHVTSIRLGGGFLALGPLAEPITVCVTHVHSPARSGGKGALRAAVEAGNVEAVKSELARECCPEDADEVCLTMVWLD